MLCSGGGRRFRQAREMGNERKTQLTVEDYFPMFIIAMQGNSVYIQVQGKNTIKEVKSLFGTKKRLLIKEVVFYYKSKVLRESDLIFNFSIRRNSIVVFVIRLRGGVVGKGASSSPKPSFREAVENRSILV